MIEKRENHETYHQVLEFVKGWNKRYETDFELHIADLKKNSSLAIGNKISKQIQFY